MNRVVRITAGLLGILIASQAWLPEARALDLPYDEALVGELELLEDPDEAKPLRAISVAGDGHLIVVVAGEINGVPSPRRLLVYEQTDAGWSYLQDLAGDCSFVGGGTRNKHGFVAVQAARSLGEPDMIGIACRGDHQEGSTHVVLVYERTWSDVAGTTFARVSTATPSYFGNPWDASIRSVSLASGVVVAAMLVSENTGTSSDVRVEQLQSWHRGAGGWAASPSPRTLYARRVCDQFDTCRSQAWSDSDGTRAAYFDGVREEVRVFLRSGITWSLEEVIDVTGLVDDTIQPRVAIDGDRIVTAGNREGPRGFRRQGSIWSAVPALVGAPGYTGSTPVELDIQDDELTIYGSEQAFPYRWNSISNAWDAGAAQPRPGRTTLSSGYGQGDGFRSGDTFWIGTSEHVAIFGSGDFTDAAATSNALRSVLYGEEPEKVYRYREFLYEPDGASGQPEPATLLLDLGTNELSGDDGKLLWGAQQRAESLEAECVARESLDLSFDDETGFDPAAGDILLDILHDRSVAELVVAGERRAAAERERFLPPPPGGFVIDGEIEKLEQVLDAYESALGGASHSCDEALVSGGYFGLLNDDVGGHQMDGVPVGYAVVRDLVPGRALVTPVDGSTLFDGFKDLALLSQGLRDYAEVAAELARLLALRDGPGDAARVAELLAEARGALSVSGTRLESVFDGQLPADRDESGVAEAITGYRTALDQINQVQQILDRDANPLGFEDDFLMLVNPGSTGEFDSFDILRELLDFSSTCVGPLTGFFLEQAVCSHEAAVTAYGEFRKEEGELLSEFMEFADPLQERLLLLGDRGIVGSEIWQQYQSVEAAVLQVTRNRQGIDNLQAEVRIEVNLREEVEGVYNGLAELQVEYGNRRASIAREMAKIEAAQKAADSVAAFLSDPSKLAAVGAVISGVVNVGGEIMKGNLEVERENLAAMEQAAVTNAESDIYSAESRAKVKTLLLQMKTLAIDSQEKALLLRQEVGRLRQLYTERDLIENRLQTYRTSLAGRYHGDPIFRRRALKEGQRARDAFDQAQKWLFFTVRALEYKWNTPFSGTAAGSPVYDIESLFKLRSGEELNDFFLATKSFDAGTDLSVERGLDVESLFSLKRDILGYLDGVDGEGRPRIYPDPMTGQDVDADTAFRSYLDTRIRLGDDCSLDERVPNSIDFCVVIDFSTVGEDVLRSFFTVDTYIDKIDWIKIRIPGDHRNAGPLAGSIGGELVYGGTSYIRTPSPGQVTDPDRPDRLAGELVAYTTRYWFQPPGQEWQSKSAQRGLPEILLGDTNLSPELEQLTTFRERSVAASGWKLMIPLLSRGTELLNLGDFEDVEITIRHLRAPRN